MAIDISTELNIIDQSDSGSAVKGAIIDALYAISQADPGGIRPYDISAFTEFGWGIMNETVIGIATEQEVS